MAAGVLSGYLCIANCRVRATSGPRPEISPARVPQVCRSIVLRFWLEVVELAARLRKVARVGRGDHVNPTGPKTAHKSPRPWRPRQGTDEGGSHRFRGRGKDFLDRSFLSRDVAVDLVPVGVVVGESGVNLRQREGARSWRRSLRESDPGCTSRRCTAGLCGSPVISQSGFRYR